MNRYQKERAQRLGAIAGVVALAVVVAGLLIALLVRDQQITQIGPGPLASSSQIAPQAPTPTSTPSATPASLDQVRDVLAGDVPVTISVLGDSTGNDTNEWVALWAKHLSEDRQVTLHMWDAAAQEYRKPAITYGDRGPKVTIWNGSQAGARASFAEPIITELQPEKPDVVLYSFGHKHDSKNIDDELGGVMRAVAAEWGDVPAAVILQNPGQGKHEAVQGKTLQRLAQWARTQGVPTVDVTSAFDDPAKQMLDDAHPNAAGSKVWAEAVAEAIV